MSKLSKFKAGINDVEAAELLSSLIGEDVSAEDIHSLFHSGYLDQFIRCSATLVRVSPMLEPEVHAAQVDQGRYIMTAGEVEGLCFGAHLPCMTIQLDEHAEVTALSDKVGNLFALRDNLTGDYLNFIDDDRTVTDVLYEPFEIYAVAEKANNPLPVEPEFSIKKNKWCEAGCEYYNFTPDSTHPQPAARPSSVSDDRPSYLLTIAAMLDVALNDPRIRSQGALSGDIEAKFKSEGLRGLGKTTVDQVFSDANKALAAARQKSTGA